MRTLTKIYLLIIGVLLSACAPAEPDFELVSPNIFLRGMQVPSGIQYVASFVKPTDATELKNVLVEITIPVSAPLAGMSLPHQTSAAEIRENGDTRTLVWRVAQVDSNAALDVFGFTLTQPLVEPLEFYMVWYDADGGEHVEHFTELPSVHTVEQSEAEISVTQTGYVPVGKSGMFVSVPEQTLPLALRVRALPVSFNPPVEYGALWWCSLLELDGVPEGETVSVAVPLRRPIAPFTPLALFQQNEDGSWSSAPGQGVVTADGLFVVYEHPGGVIATGGDEDLQPEQVELSWSGDGESNTVIVAEEPPIPDENESNPSGEEVPPVTDGTSNTVIIEESNLPPSDPPQDATNNVPGNEAAPTETIQDGTSNTVIIGESSAPSTESANVAPAEGIQDGTSNTVIIGESPASPTESTNAAPAEGIQDGTSNTILIGEVTFTPAAGGTAVPSQSITDGTSNTVIIGEVTPTPNQVVRIVTVTPTLQTPVVSSPTRTPVVAALPPVVVVNPKSFNAVPEPLGKGNIRIMITFQPNGMVQQCQAGGISCAVLRRTVKK